jgi:hypothetical protein
MAARLTLRDRPGTVTIADEATVRAVAVAVATWNRDNVDTAFRVRRPSPRPHIRRNIRFQASQVAGLNANGVDLVDLGSPIRVAVAA